MLGVLSILTDQKLLAQFDSMLTWEMELLVYHKEYCISMITKQLKVVSLQG